MPEIHYKCHVEMDEHMVEVNVFSMRELNKKEISEQAIIEAKRFAEELGRDVPEKVIPIGYSKGWFG